MAKDLMFQLAIEGPGKRLKEIKDQIDGWAKDMTIPIKVTADLNELKRQLKDLGVVFGENNKEIKKLATRSIAIPSGGFVETKTNKDKQSNMIDFIFFIFI